MILDCLDGLVGAKLGCDNGTSSSGLWLTDKDYMDLSAFESVTSEANSTANKLLETTLKEAKAFVAQDIYSHFSSSIKTESVVDNKVAGFYQENLELIVGETKYKGIHLKVSNMPYVELLISNVSLQLSSSANVTIVLFDLLTGKQIDSTVITTVADEITRKEISFKILNYKQRMSLFIGYDSSGLDSYKTNISDIGCQGCSGQVNIVQVNPVKLGLASTKTDANLVSISETGGLSITYSLSCNIEPFICSVKDILAYPLRERWCLEILRRMKSSRRTNSITIVYSGDIEELIADVESNYALSMDRILKNLMIPDEVCFKCNKRITKRIQVP